MPKFIIADTIQQEVVRYYEVEGADEDEAMDAFQNDQRTNVGFSLGAVVGDVGTDFVDGTPADMIRDDQTPGGMTMAELLEASRIMRQRGGGFAATIADAFDRADIQNQRRLLAAFGSLFRRYAPERWPTAAEIMEG